MRRRVLSSLGLEQVFRGRIQVNSNLSTPKYPDVFVAGDQAGICRHGFIFFEATDWTCNC